MWRDFCTRALERLSRQMSILEMSWRFDGLKLLRFPSRKITAWCAGIRRWWCCSQTARWSGRRSFICFDAPNW